MTDAYATIKVLATLQKRRHIRLIVNQVSAAGEGRTIRNQLQLVVDRFVAPQLKAEGDPVPLVLELIGEIPIDPAVREAVSKRSLLLDDDAGIGGGQDDHRRSGARRGLSGAQLAGLEQHDQGAVAAVGGAGVGEGQHLAALHQPATCTLRLEHRLAARASRGPCRARRARSAGRCCAASRRKAARRSRASSRRRPCRSISPCIAQTPRRSLRTTSMPMPRRRNDSASSVSSSDSASKLVGDRLDAAPLRRRARAGVPAAPAAAGRGAAMAGAAQRHAPGRPRWRRGCARVAPLRPARARRPACASARGAARAAAARISRQLLERAGLDHGFGVAFTAAPARRSTRPGPGRRPGGRAPARRPAPARSSASASGTRRRATARPRREGWLCASTTAAASSSSARLTTSRG